MMKSGDAVPMPPLIYPKSMSLVLRNSAEVVSLVMFPMVIVKTGLLFQLRRDLVATIRRAMVVSTKDR